MGKNIIAIQNNKTKPGYISLETCLCLDNKILLCDLNLVFKKTREFLEKVQKRFQKAKKLGMIGISLECLMFWG